MQAYILLRIIPLSGQSSEKPLDKVNLCLVKTPRRGSRCLLTCTPFLLSN